MLETVWPEQRWGKGDARLTVVIVLYYISVYP